MRNLCTAALWALLMSLTGACSSDDGTSFENYVREGSALACQRMSTCCAQAGNPIDKDQCDSMIDYAVQNARQQLDSGDYEFDSAAAEECLTAFRAAVDDCGAASPPACDRALHGTKAPGAACEDDEECALPASGTAECDWTGSEGGTCVQTVDGKVGDACKWTCDVTAGGESCFGGGTGEARCLIGDGLFCNGETSQCQALAAVGASCGGGGMCEPGLFCEYGEAGSTCAATLAVGADCADKGGDACGEGHCGDDGKCQAPKAEGEACDSSAWESGCIDGTHCSDAGRCEADGLGLSNLACGMFNAQ